MRAEINRPACIGCGACENLCPAVFRMAGDGRAEVCGKVDNMNRAQAEEARDGCPVSVISLLEITSR